MNTIRLNSILIVAAALSGIFAPAARADDSSSGIAFSDPSKPGTLRIRVSHGEVAVHGADVKVITVKSESTPVNSAPRKDGLRVLSASASYVLTEKGNVATLEYGYDGSGGSPADFEVTVPRDTAIIVGNSIHGDFRCDGVSGDVDVRTLNGDVKLADISGGALVESTNGDITVGVKALAPSRPLSFSSMNGKVTIRVPADLKAAIRFRTHRGMILTNFDDKALVTRTEISRRALKKAPKGSSHDKAPVAADSDEAPVAPVAPTADSDDSDGDWHTQVRESIREAAIAAADAARQAADAVHEQIDMARMDMSGAFTPGSPIPPLPPMTGGKIVSGTLNGGGGEIQASTLNGDIVLKKAE
jgi:putative adhesin